MTAADLAPSSLSPTVLAWSQGLASFSPGQPPCPGFRPDEWVTTLSNARRFVDDFGLEAERLGWDTTTLFAGTGRASCCRPSTRSWRYRPAPEGASLDGGAQHWAVIASLVEICQLNGVEPQAYLTDVLTRIVEGHPNSRIDELLP